MLTKFTGGITPVLWFVLGTSGLAQTPCNTPIVVQSVTVLNSTCGNTTGAIILNISGGHSGLTFNWTPNVPGTNTIFDVPADAYRVNIVRNSNTNCRLDTTIIVNNSDGPPTQVIQVKPANCFARNGQVVLAPSNLSYLWSNSETGAVNDSLSSGCYTITATTGNGCYSVLQACVPNVNSLQVTAAILKPAKCGKANGKVGLTITGGTGNYDYCLGNSSPTLNSLSAGAYTCTITDKVTGCKANVSFTVPAANPQATVKLSTYNVKCPGNNDGFVVFSVEPGANFEFPYTFVLKNAASGANASPGALPPGLYDLTINDADGCPLPPASFLISAPPPFSQQNTLTPPSCAQPGKLLLNLSGGNGKYIVDWADLPGSNNSRDRYNIGPGLYSATVYDSLFCQYPVAPIFVPNNCNRADTLYHSVEAGTSDTFCLTLPTGISQGAFALYGKSVSGTSAYGNWTLRPEGCIVYKAKTAPGYALDTICVQAVTGVNGLTKSWCMIVSVTADPPLADSVYFTVQVNAAATACGNIPPEFKQPIITRINGSGLKGSSGSFGSYTINPANACLTFQSLGQTGYFVDNIYVNVYDRLLRRNKTICYIPSVLPLADCLPAIAMQDTLQLQVQNCHDFAVTCLPVPFNDAAAYAIIDNGAPYTNGFAGCNTEEKTAYAVSQLPLNGPFTLLSWAVGAQSFSGVFANPTGLTALMNQIDPEGNWMLRNNALIIGGKAGKTYGTLKVSTGVGTSSTLFPLKEPVARGTQMRFSAGLHRLTFRQFSSGCIDTLFVRVKCSLCPPVHAYNTSGQDVLRWEIKNCRSDTVFCTTIPSPDLKRYVLKDNGLPVAKLTACAANVGIVLDTGYHALVITDALGICQYKANVLLQCPVDLPLQTQSLTLETGAQKNVCIDTSALGGQLVSFSNVCPALSGTHAGTLIDTRFKCATFTGLLPGRDTVCLKLCNKLGACAEYRYYISVLAKADSLVANPDFFYGTKNGTVEGNLLSNDYAGAPPLVTAMIAPGHGQLTIEPGSGHFEYTPDRGYCGLDTFRYSLQTASGAVAEALVSIRIVCEKILIFNGISPNGDGENDVWHLPGIDQYAQNKVSVFNRWGNLVFEAAPYSNQSPWDGRWNEQDLPDGTYYYLIDLGDGSEPLKGYIQLRR